MDGKRLVAALATEMPTNLAQDLVDSFLTIRQDASTRTYGRAAPGKFVETLVQILQHKRTGRYDASPDVDAFLKNSVENYTTLDDGLRICAARVGRAIYTFRNKRNIAHKGAIDPNTYDLDFIHAAARWVMAELLRLAQSLKMEEAGALIEMVHAPIGRLVEEIDGRRIVHGNLSVRNEILVLLHSHYPDHVAIKDIITSMDRQNEKSIKLRLRELYAEKLIQGDSAKGYRLTTTGFDTAVAAIIKAQQKISP